MEWRGGPVHQRLQNELPPLYFFWWVSLVVLRGGGGGDWKWRVASRSHLFVGEDWQVPQGVTRKNTRMSTILLSTSSGLLRCSWTKRDKRADAATKEKRSDNVVAFGRCGNGSRRNYPCHPPAIAPPPQCLDDHRLAAFDLKNSVENASNLH